MAPLSARTRRGVLVGILLAAIGIRLVGIDFGLPAMLDPDEPTFIIRALTLLREGTFNPGWFGHPGSTTIYSIALMEAAVVGSGLLTGRFADVEDAAAATYADPGVLILPVRFMMAACGVLCVALTYWVGRRCRDHQTGLIAAALLAINAVHVIWSQVIRTDVQAGVFMLLAAGFAADAAQRGRVRSFVLAGLATGFACATKWPTATVGIVVIGAGVLRLMAGDGWWRSIVRTGVGGASSLVGLFLASPFIFLSWPTVLANVSNEVKVHHLGATGGAPLWNAWWYVTHPLAGSLGWPALVLLAAGIVFILLRSRVAVVVVLLPLFAFVGTVITQHLVWARWIVPVLPFIALILAIAAREILRLTSGTKVQGAAIAGLIAMAVPMGFAVHAAVMERLLDTRTMATDWAKARFPAGTTVLTEHLATDLLSHPWGNRFPLGIVGCRDGRDIMRGQIDPDSLEAVRNLSPIVNIGTVSPDMIDTCQADYAIVSDYDRYRAEAFRFPAELDNYRVLLRGATQIAVFKPEPGRIGGPVVRIYRMRRSQAGGASAPR